MRAFLFGGAKNMKKRILSCSLSAMLAGEMASPLSKGVTGTGSLGGEVTDPTGACQPERGA
jgi:hypothetical protein